MEIRPALQRGFNHLRIGLEWLLPATCICCRSLCGEPAWLCPACIAAINHNFAPCRGCALPGVPLGWCSGCMSRRNTPTGASIDRCFSPLLYEGVVAQLVHKWKFEKAAALTELLVDSAGRFDCGDLGIDCLVPIPISFRKRLQRGYNQSHLLAAELRHRHFRHHSDVRIVRALNESAAAKTQHKLNRRARSENAARRFVPRCSMEHRRVLLVDDVMTTGATLRAAASTLKAAGAERVYAWSLARTPGVSSA